MFIVDYKTDDYFKAKELTRTFENDQGIIQFVADESDNSKFQLVRINKYEKGVLHPYEMRFSKGRIVLESAPLNVKGEIE